MAVVGEEAGKVDSVTSLKKHWRKGILSVEFGPDSENSFEVKAKLEVTQQWPSGCCFLVQGCSPHRSSMLSPLPSPVRKLGHSLYVGSRD